MQPLCVAPDGLRKRHRYQDQRDPNQHVAVAREGDHHGEQQPGCHRLPDRRAVAPDEHSYRDRCHDAQCQVSRGGVKGPCQGEQQQVLWRRRPCPEQQAEEENDCCAGREPEHGQRVQRVPTEQLNDGEADERDADENRPQHRGQVPARSEHEVAAHDASNQEQDRLKDEGGDPDPGQVHPAIEHPEEDDPHPCEVCRGEQADELARSTPGPQCESDHGRSAGVANELHRPDSGVAALEHQGQIQLRGLDRVDDEEHVYDNGCDQCGRHAYPFNGEPPYRLRVLWSIALALDGFALFQSSSQN